MGQGERDGRCKTRLLLCSGGLRSGAAGVKAVGSAVPPPPVNSNSASDGSVGAGPAGAAGFVGAGSHFGLDGPACAGRPEPGPRRMAESGAAGAQGPARPRRGRARAARPLRRCAGPACKQ